MCEVLTVEDLIHLEEATKRIPNDLKGHSYYSAFDLYQYIAIMDDRTCKRCMIFDRMIVTGDLMRSYFPFSQIIGDNQLLVHEHPNCRCTLLRVTNLSDYISYTEPTPTFPSVKYAEPTVLPRHKENPDYNRGTVRTTTLDDLGIELTEKKQRERIY